MKDVGLIKKYNVTKIANPEKEVDGMVFEFDSAIGRKILSLASEVYYLHGYPKLAEDIKKKLEEYSE